MRMKKLALMFLPLFVVGIAVSLFLFAGKSMASLYGSGDVVINEFTTTGTPWIELLNTTGTDIDLSSPGWQILVDTQGPAYHSTTTLSSGIIPAKGLLTVPVINNILPNGLVTFDTIIRVVYSGAVIHSVTYGPVGSPDVLEPGPAHSAIMTGTSTPAWSVTSSVSKGWFNETVNSMDCNNPPAPGVGQPPSLSAIVACIPAVTNMADTSTIPDATHAAGLYFSTSTGKIDYGSSVLNLTDQNTRGLLETLGTNMKINGGQIGLNASTTPMLKNPPSDITIDFYNMKNLGYSNINTSSLKVKDDSGAIIPTSSGSFPSLNTVAWDPNSNNGTFSFNSNHFSEYDIKPIVTEVTPVPTPTSSASVPYTFYTNVTGTYRMSNNCTGFPSDLVTVNGNNTIAINPGGEGTFSCSITVKDGAGATTSLNITPFTIVLTPPGTPTGLTATPVSQSEIDLAWDSTTSPAVDYYKVFFGASSTILSVVGTTTAHTYNKISLSTNTPYWFKVSGVNIAGEGVSSTIVSTSTLQTAPPNAPTNIGDTPTSTSAIIISWTAPVTNTPDYYRVYSATSSLIYQIVGTTTASVYTFTHNGNGPSTEHFYYVSSVNSGGETDSDHIVSYTFPNPPTSLVITASSSNSLTAFWNPNGNGSNATNSTQYEIYKNGVAVSPEVVATSSVISSLIPNTPYSIVVKAQSGKGDKSASSSAAVEWTRPADPQSLILTTSTSNSLTFSWSANNNPAGTYYNLNNAGFGSIYTTSTTYTVSPLPSATTYSTITIRAVSYDYPNQSYTSGGDTLASASTQANDPASLATTASTSNSISLQWNANGNAGGTVYQISGVGFATVTTTATSTTIGSLSPNTGYTFTVKAQNPDSSYTTGISISGQTKSAAPVSLATTASTSVSLSLAWADNGNPAGTSYQIYGSGFATTTVSATTTVLSGLTPNTSYSVYVRAQNPDNSYTVAVNKTDYTKAAIPGTPTATISGPGSVSLSWDAGNNPSGTVYMVTFYPSGTPINPPATTTALSATASGLTPGDTYQFQVLAANINGGGSSPASSSSLPVNLSAPTVATNPASNVASTAVTLNGNITSIGGGNATSRGFNLGTTTSYTSTSTEPGSFGTGAFTYSGFVLTPGTVYHYRAWALNSVGPATGSDSMFISAFAPTAGNPTSTITGADTATSTVNVPSSVTNATVDLSSLTSGNSTTLPGALQVSADTSLGTVQVSIPAGTKITADDTWDGTLVLPTIKDNSSVTVTADSGKTATVNGVVEIGFGDVALTLDRGARILIPGKAGKDAGYYRDGTFTKITATCAGDSQSVGDLLGTGADCKIDAGSDLVIWTKHFTKFTTYTQTSQSSGGGGGGGGYFGTTATTTVATSTPVVVTPVTPIVSAPTGVAPSYAVANNSSSVVSFSNLPLASVQPGITLKFNYSYTNTGSKSSAIKIVRVMLNSKAKSIKTVKTSKTLKAGATLTGKVSEILPKTTPPGRYTISVNVYDAKTKKLIGGNNFNITVERLKKKYFTLGEVSSADSVIAFDPASLAKIKSNAVLPVILRAKYSYVNNTSANQTIRMVRRLIDSSGKVISTKIGKWTMKVGEKDSSSFTQPVAGNLAAGEYSVKISALDYATKKVLAENSLAFGVVLK